MTLTGVKKFPWNKFPCMVLQAESECELWATLLRSTEEVRASEDWECRKLDV
jgi:hypothetical protein